jgi:hypothetical protein
MVHWTIERPSRSRFNTIPFHLEWRLTEGEEGRSRIYWSRKPAYREACRPGPTSVELDLPWDHVMLAQAGN